MSYHGIFSRDKNSLQKFIAKKSGKNKDRGDFELCGNCNEEWKKFFSQELKEKIIKELKHRKSVKYLEDYNNNYYFNQQYLLESDWTEAKQALVENIKRYKNEWEIKEMNWNRNGEYYYDGWQREREREENK